MKELFLITFLCLGLSTTSSSLFDGIRFNEQGIGYKTNIPVIYHSIGKAVNEECLRTLKKGFNATTALSFTYNDKEYYISIEEKKMPKFVSNLIEGELIFIDIVVFNTTDCYPTGRSNKSYCAFINKIRKKD
jgi:hypothetical protein